jgi:hypothetical protein
MITFALKVKGHQLESNRSKSFPLRKKDKSSENPLVERFSLYISFDLLFLMVPFKTISAKNNLPTVTFKPFTPTGLSLSITTI